MEPTPERPLADSPAVPGSAGTRFQDLRLLALLFLLVVPLRTWIAFHTEVLARDSIGYIRYALEFEHLSWSEVLARHHQHPGYSLSILAASWPVRAVLGPADAFNMQVSAQLASSLAALLLVVPMFYLGKTLLDRQAGFWAALLFQFLPVSGHLLSDGLSEALFLLLIMTGLLLAVQALRAGAPWRFGVCGLVCGLAYLTRPEGALLLFAAGVVLLAQQRVAERRLPWKQVLVCGSCLVTGALVAGSPYYSVTKVFTRKPSIRLIAGKEVVQGPDAPAPQTTPRPLSASVWAAFFDKTGPFPDRLRRGVAAIAWELGHAFHYAGLVPVLLGLWWYRGKMRSEPGLWVGVTLCSLHTVCVLALAISQGYVSDRHIMILVLGGCYAAAAGLRDLPARLLALWPVGRTGSPSDGHHLSRWAAPAGTALLTALVMWCLPKTLQPLHANRAGHHAAGLWLAERVHPGDTVLDDHCWAHYYAGQVFAEHLFQKDHKPQPAPPGHECTRYVVIGRSRDPEVAQRRHLDEEQIRAQHGRVVYHWPDVDTARVVVYAIRNQ